MSIFILGANGTLGLQLALTGRKLNLSVTCLVRRYTNETDALTFLGARIFYGDMNNETVLLESIFGSNVIIDASTGRLFDPLQKVEYDGKLLLLRVAEELEIERFIFFSLVNAEKFDTIPLVQAKLFMESVIKRSTVPYTIFRMTGVYQGLVKEYAIPVFDQNRIFLTDNYMPICYIDCIDVARLVLRSFSSSKFVNKTVNISGLKSWTPQQVLEVCEKRSGLKARTRYIPIIEILTVRFITSLFQSTWYMTRKLALIDIIRRNTPDLVLDPTEMLELFEITPDELRSFDYYIYYYYERAFEMIYKRLGGNEEDDERELEEWRKKGATVFDSPIFENDEV